MTARRLIVAVSASLVGVMLLVGCGPTQRDSAGQPPKGPIIEAGAKALFGWLGDSVKGTVGSDLVGWGLGALGFGNGEEQKLEQIQNQLTAIQADLTQISNEIAQLADQLQLDVCAIQTSEMNQAVSIIQSNTESFNALLGPTPSPTPTSPTPSPTPTSPTPSPTPTSPTPSPTPTSPTPSPTSTSPTWGQLVAWAEQISAADTGIQPLLFEINNGLGGLAGTPGSIQQCGAALVAAQWKPLFNEASYYQWLHSYINYFYDVQVQGLNLLVEAYHLLASQAAMKAGVVVSDLSQVQADVCGNPVQAAATYCNLAAAIDDQVYGFIQGQLQMGGAGYGDGSNGSLAAQLGTANVWVRDISDFQTGGCGIPLSSTTGPCGGAVGTTGSFANPNFAGYSTWAAATYSQWEPLLNTTGNGGTQVGKLMYDLGLVNDGDTPSNLIIYTGEVVNTTNSDWNFNGGAKPPSIAFVAAQCLLDTSMNAVSGQRWPFCDGVGGESLADLMTGGKYCYQMQGDPFTCSMVQSPGFDFSNESYYSGQVWVYEKTDPLAFGPPPGWVNQGSWQPKDQFRWPVMNTNDLTCTNGMNRQTSWNAPTMCGADFQTWLTNQLPDAPSTTSPGRGKTAS